MNNTSNSVPMDDGATHRTPNIGCNVIIVLPGGRGCVCCLFLVRLMFVPFCFFYFLLRVLLITPGTTDKTRIRIKCGSERCSSSMDKDQLSETKLAMDNWFPSAKGILYSVVHCLFMISSYCTSW